MQTISTTRKQSRQRAYAVAILQRDVMNRQPIADREPKEPLDWWQVPLAMLVIALVILVVLWLQGVTL